MIRQVAAMALAVLIPASASAQGTARQAAPSSISASELRVTRPSAVIYRSPSTGSPVLGTARRGAVLAVTRELGSWLRVVWPESEDGTGYVHVTSGSLVHGTSAAAAPGTYTSTPALSETRTMAPIPVEQLAATESSAAARTTYVATPSHIVGLGGRMSGSAFGMGVTGRAWTRKRLGVQVELSRASLTSTAAFGRVTSLQFAPSAIYSLRDHVSDYVWVRPYVGGGGNFNRQSWSTGTPDATDSITDSTFGFRVFGGSEFTFSSVPRFSVSADAGYDWSKPSFTGFDFGGFGFGISGHWYVK